MSKILIIAGEVPIPDSLSGQAKVHGKLEPHLEALRAAIVDAGGTLNDRVATRKAPSQPAAPVVTEAEEKPPTPVTELPPHRSGSSAA